MTSNRSVADEVLSGNPRGLARAITIIENREPGYRELVSMFHQHAGSAAIIGVTGSPGSGKSTLVDKLTAQYRADDLRVGIVGIDPSSPFSGGAVLGDRIRMKSSLRDADVFFRSMSARGALGGISPATSEVILAFDAYGMDRIVIETVGAGQNEVDIVRLADTTLVLVQPESGDDIQMLKAGILEIGDIFAVNKADIPDAHRTVKQLRTMLAHRPETPWDPPVIETIATDGTGIDDVQAAIEDHREFLVESGELDARRRRRYRSLIHSLLRSNLSEYVDEIIDHHGGIDTILDEVLEKSTDPYAVVTEIMAPIDTALEDDPSTDDP